MVGHDQQLTKAYNDEVRRRVKKTVDNQKKHDEKTVGKKHDETTVDDNWGSWEEWWWEDESWWTGKDTIVGWPWPLSELTPFMRCLYDTSSPIVR